MPSNYAHHRFGVQLLPTLPADVRASVAQHRNLFDVGLNGPDLFFFHSFVGHTPTGKLGTRFHRQSGREFFTRVCDALRPAPNDASLAYLYGVLAHYCLDSHCHPFVGECVNRGEVSHTALESDFDRYLLQLDGKRAPNCKPNRPLRRLSRADCAVVSRFYAPATPSDIAYCNNKMRFAIATLSTGNPALHAVVKAAVSTVAPKGAGMILPRQSNPRLIRLDEELLARYRTALARYPELLASLRSHLSTGAPLCAAFGPAFG